MKTKLVYVLIGVLVLVAGFLLLRPVPPTPPPSGRGANGDPLPPWAMARIGRLAVSPGGKLVAWSDMNAVPELWSVRRGKRRTRLPGHSGHILELAFSPDGKRLASRSADGTILIWDVSAWE